MITLRHDFLIRPLSAESNHLQYPFKKMLVGESFFVKPDANLTRKVKIAMATFEKNHPGRYFEMKKVDGGHRVWRIA